MGATTTAPGGHEIALSISELIDQYDGDEYAAADEILSALNSLETDAVQPVDLRRNADKIFHIFAMLGEFWNPEK